MMTTMRLSPELALATLMTPFVLFGLAGVGIDWSCLVAMTASVHPALLEKYLESLEVPPLL